MIVDLHVFVRPPRRGAVKTRLQAGIGAVAALAVYRRLLHQTLAVAGHSGLPTTVWSAERPWHPRLRQWCATRGFALRTQGPGDLGLRMRRALGVSLQAGRGAVIVGSDCPQLEPGALHDAVCRLVDHDLVLGPADDGGYYLLGLRHSAPELFRRMRWSQPDVLVRTLRRARLAGMQTSLLTPLVDIDEAADLRATGCEHWRQPGPINI